MLRACAREGLWHEALSLLEYGSGAQTPRASQRPLEQCGTRTI
jgi:hypothetical protein